MSEAVTQKDSLSGVMVIPVQAPRLLCSEVRTIRLERDADRNISREAGDFTLARKAANEIKGTRTANRHR